MLTDPANRARPAPPTSAPPKPGPPPRAPMDPDEHLAEAVLDSLEHDPADHAVGTLLSRHWAAVSGYAALCTARSAPAGVLTAEAFSRCFGDTQRRRGPVSAWRPWLLMTTHQIATEWADDHRRPELAPGLLAALDKRRTAGQGGGSQPEPHRQVAFQAFRSMPEPAQCLLWHTEVEAEPLSVPVGLLGLDPDRAAGQLARVHDLFRSYCLQVHLDLAPEEECLRYARLLDAVTRREDATPPDDLRRHLAECGHCAATAEQLAHGADRTARVLAEAVLGWAAQQYLDLRADRRLPTAPPVPGRAENRRAGAPRRGRRPGVPTRIRRIPLRAAALLTVGVTLTGLLSALLVLDRDPHSTTPAAEAADSAVTGPSSAAPSNTAQASGTGFQEVGDTTPALLRNAATDLCLDIVGETPETGADVTLTACGQAARQWWSFDRDGRVHNAADPDLCLDSRPDESFLMGVRKCGSDTGTPADGLRFDLTVHGVLVPQWDADLAVAMIPSARTALIVVKTRDDSTAQRWVHSAPETPAASERAQAKATSNGQTVSTG